MWRQYCVEKGEENKIAIYISYTTHNRRRDFPIIIHRRQSFSQDDDGNGKLGMLSPFSPSIHIPPPYNFDLWRRWCGVSIRRYLLTCSAASYIIVERDRYSLHLDGIRLKFVWTPRRVPW
jgi:hypothetical protein